MSDNESGWLERELQREMARSIRTAPPQKGCARCVGRGWVDAEGTPYGHSPRKCPACGGKAVPGRNLK